ncbi:MAG: type III PLP-dependent enzyme [Pseudomonadota bacterium]
MNQTLAVETPAITSRAASLQTFGSVDAVVDALKPAEPVYCLYPRVLQQVAGRFVTGFPGRTLYAVKANPHPEIIRELYGAGIRHFDTASLREVALVKEHCPDATCYFMAICKLAGAAETAFFSYGVRNFVADHESEVDRLLALADQDTTIHIRMKAFDPASVYELSSKFGAEPEEVARLLRRVADAGLQPGLAFNVGSLCRHPDAYRRAITAAEEVVTASGVAIVSLDVGGGFPTDYPGLGTDPVDAFFDAIRETAGNGSWIGEGGLMCEPGRALVAEGQSLLVQVILIKDDMVFLNDGVYGGLSELNMSSNAVQYPWRVIRPGGAASAARRSYAISGPTCDTLDVLPHKMDLPADLAVGDWIEFGLAGAYTNATSTRFNGFHTDHWVRIEGEGVMPPGELSTPR